MVKSNTVFIGHGRSEQWRALKDLLKERLGLPIEEFSRVSPAGISTQERLGEMLDRCGFAFLVFTAKIFIRTALCMLAKMSFTRPVYFKVAWAGVGL
jgi:hypothetical protein